MDKQGELYMIFNESESKALEELAKTGGKALDLMEKMGAFIARLTKGTLEEGFGIFEDKLKYMRWKNQFRLIIRANEFINESGINEITRPLPLKFTIPLLQGASLEDDEYLQDLWAQLLANSVIENGIEIKRVYIDILERLSPLEGKIIKTIYGSFSFEEIQHRFLLTYKLPEFIEIQNDDSREHPEQNNPAIQLALINLSRIGCLSLTKSLGGGEFFSLIHPTLLGKYFYEACTKIVRNIETII
jgi:hypothetical protein